ncbi:uncharacterized protein LOC100846733 [Brachypodium distachyon]|nr:uncharacterized protein LOC100846733 [Brachypodium distachyon]|eukprot:XP_003573242.1 uncharacterized protein LOC100846733 [Brachypodium distachyon]
MFLTHGTSDGAATRKIGRNRNRLFMSTEKKNPTNVQFERQVARLESRQQQSRRVFFTALVPFEVLCELEPSLHAENGNNHPSSEPTSPEDSLGPPSSAQSSPSIIFIHVAAHEDAVRNCAANPLRRLLQERSTASNSMPDSDFLDSTFANTSVDAKHTTRRKSKKKSKKHRQRLRKPTDGYEIKCAESNSSSHSVDMVDSCEGSTLSPKHVGDMEFDDAFSPSSSVKEPSEKAPDSENDNEYTGCSVASVSSASYSDETELSRQTTSCLEVFGQCNGSNRRSLDDTSSSKRMDSSQELGYAGRSGKCSDKIMTSNACGHDPCEITELHSFSDGVDDYWLEKSDCDRGFCSQNGVGVCNGAQAVHLCSNGNRGSDFSVVVSRKRARKEKKMSKWKSFSGEHASADTHSPNEKCTGPSSRLVIKELYTKECSHRQAHVGSIQPQNGVVLKCPIKNFIHEQSNRSPLKHSESGTGQIHFTSPKENSNIKSNGDFDKEQNIDLNKRLPNAVHCRESSSCEMRSHSASEPTTPKSAKGNFTSESGKSSSHAVEDFPMNTRVLQGSPQVNYATGTGSGRPSPDPKSTQTALVVGCGVIPSFEGKHSFGKSCSSEMNLNEMIKVVNDAYEVQIAADVHLSVGCPVTDLETFLYSATPVIGHVPCVKSSNCSQGQLVENPVYQQYKSVISLRNVWEWYEEPGCFGLEVSDLNDHSSKTSHFKDSEFCAYFVPYLSAIQLFGRSKESTDNDFSVQEGDLLEASNTTSLLSSHAVRAKLHKPFEQRNTFFSESAFPAQGHGRLIFEYFETEQPSFRPPLFDKIKELSGLNVSGHPTLGDPEMLQNMKLCDLHPASWYCVAWYPVYRVPHGSFRAAFLTYHSLGKLVPQNFSPDLTGGYTSIVSPVVGLQSYNDKGEQWFELRSPGSMKRSGAEVVKARLTTLKRGAMALARAVIPRGSVESSVNHHPDYEFFLSRST